MNIIKIGKLEFNDDWNITREAYEICQQAITKMFSDLKDCKTGVEVFYDPEKGSADTAPVNSDTYFRELFHDMIGDMVAKELRKL